MSIMKSIRTYIQVFAVALMAASCNALDLAPVDTWSINNYWNTEEQCERFLQGLQYRMRERAETFMQMGELRGGTMNTSSITSIGEGAYNIEAVANNLSEANPVFTNWGNFYMDIYQINHAIDKITDECSFLSDDQRNMYLGRLHGMRAFYYFHMLRTWGGVPLCDKPDVLMTSEIAELRKERASERKTWEFVRDDADLSFGYYSKVASPETDKAYWNFGATCCLRAEVYLWGVKVKPLKESTVLSSDVQGDLEKARVSLEKIQSSYSLNDDFADAFSPYNKDSNTEVIFAMRYMLNEKTNFYSNYTYNVNTFTQYCDGTGKKLDNPLNIGSGAMRYEYSGTFYDSFGDEDKRRDATFLQFYRNEEGSINIAGRCLCKFIGEANNGNNQYTNDFPVYRYSDVALMFAEIYNELGQGGQVKTWMDLVRDRAYGDGVNPFTYTSKEDAEEAILAERSKEFVAEGKRWYDIRRMAGAKYALDLVQDNELKLVWPIDSGVLAKDNLVKQNEGYIVD